MTRFASRYEELELDPLWTVTEDDMVVSWLEMHGRTRQAEEHSSAIYALQIRDGRVIDYWLAQSWLPRH